MKEPWIEPAVFQGHIQSCAGTLIKNESGDVSWTESTLSEQNSV